MVKFGERLNFEARRLPESWRDFFLDYETLKKRLEVATEAEGREEEDAQARDFIRKATRNSFQHLLDSELEKVLAFYKRHAAILVIDIDELKEETRHISETITLAPEIEDFPKTNQELKNLADLWVKKAKCLENLLLFLSLNMEGLRKIMKKYKKCAPSQVQSRPGLVTLRLDHESLPGGFVEQGSFLPADIVEEINCMKDHTELVACSQAIKEAFLQLDVMRSVLYSKKKSGRSRFLSVPVRIPLPVSRRAQQSIRVLKESIGNYTDLSPIIRALSEAQKRANENLSVIQATPAVLETQVGIFTAPPPDEAAFATLPGLIANLLSAFMYMTNYNLVLPTNEEFCIHIGSYGSMTGVIVGMADLTAVGISILYGWWSNTSFKQPLIASSALCIVGNILYCFAWDAGSFGLVLLLAGRLLTGMGSCRAVNRRYIADFVSKKRRTAASAAFVAASAGGSAVGPLLAVPLSMVKPSKVLGRFSLNSITAGGWLMVLCWFVFALYILFRFQDPPMNRDTDSSDDEESALSESVQNEDHPQMLPKVRESNESESNLSQPLLEPEARVSGFDMQPAYLCILSLFALKFMQQGMISSAPEFTHQFYHWSSSAIGFFLSIISIGMLPVNFLVAVVASFFSDRKLLLCAEIFAVVGVLCMLSYNGSAPIIYLYITGTLLVYSSTIVMESVSMSLLSKKIPPSMSRGTCNAGLLATQAGSFGRFIGNMLITIYGGMLGGHLNSLTKIVHFDWAMYGTLSLMGLLTTVYTVAVFKRLRTV